MSCGSAAVRAAIGSRTVSQVLLDHEQTRLEWLHRLYRDLPINLVHLEQHAAAAVAAESDRQEQVLVSYAVDKLAVVARCD